jgi:hypothetical protein
MKYLKLYEQFRLLEDIQNLDKIVKSSENEFVRELSGKVKECLESIFPNQNLKYLAAGGVGLTFQWLDSPELPEDFYKVGFIGKKCDIKEKCIKVTMSDTESEQIKIRVGKHDKGLCEYFWTKETEWQGKKIYLICMDFLDMPNVEQKMVIHLIFLLSFIQGTNYLHDKVDDKLKNVFEWLKSGNPEYSEEDFDKNFKSKFKIQNQIGLKLDTLVGMFCFRNKIVGQEMEIKESWKKMDQDFFMSLSKNVLDIYKIAKNQPSPLNIEDIHENNMGYRKGELVAFDFI